MKIVVRILALAALAALAVWLWTVLFPGPEKIIRRRLADVARTASFAPKEGMIARAANAQKLAGYFAPQTEVNIDLPGREQHELAGRDEIAQAALVARNNFRALQVEFLDTHVTLAADKESAVANLTVKGKIPDDKDFLVQEMKITLKKTDGTWLITRVETVKTLQ